MREISANLLLGRGNYCQETIIVSSNVVVKLYSSDSDRERDSERVRGSERERERVGEQGRVRK